MCNFKCVTTSNPKTQRTNVILVTVLVLMLSQLSEQKQIAGYYRSWKVYTTCKIEEIDPNLNTILYYAFATVHENGSIAVLDHNADILKGGYKRFTALKQKNPKLKTLLSIGGGQDESEKYSKIVKSKEKTKTFISSTIEYIENYGFDGIDFDWEYPAKFGGKPEDKENFPLFLKEVREEFDKHGYLLTVAVGPAEFTIETSYDVPQISKYAHYINLMTYNMHTYADGRTGQNAPLYSNDKLNIDYCTKAWISRGADPQKLLLGVASYGRSFTLSDPNKHGIGAPTSGPGAAGPISNSPGSLSFVELLGFEKSGWAKEWSDEQQVPYLYKDDQWVGYDDEKSVQRKVEYAQKQNLGGIMMWAVDMDDPRSMHGEAFPLLKVINRCIRKYK